MSDSKAATPQPAPKHEGEVVLPYVLADLQARAEFGKRKYGDYLMTGDGRDGLWDAYQEQLDDLMYTRKLILEREEEHRMTDERVFDSDGLLSAMDELNVEQERINAKWDALIEKFFPGMQEEMALQAKQEQADRAARLAERREQKAKRKAPQQPEEAIPMSNRVDPDVMEVLQETRCEGLKLYLPPAQLERNLYERVNTVLVRLGGKWKGGKVRAHIFEDEPAPLLVEVLATGIMPLDNPLDFYRTPGEVLGMMIERAQHMAPNATMILEPSAGDGAIATGLRTAFPGAQITVVEIDPKRAAKLRAIDGITVIEGDFLQHTGAYELIVMNPPFSIESDKLEYVAHIEHAYTLLCPGGALVSVAPSGLKYRTDKRTAHLREMVERDGNIEDAPGQAFEVSGTSVATVILALTKPASVGMYYTPMRVVEPAAGTGALLATLPMFAQGEAS